MRMYAVSSNGNSGLGSSKIHRWRIIIGRFNNLDTLLPTASLLFQDPNDTYNSLYNRVSLERKLWIPMYDARFDTAGEDANAYYGFNNVYFHWKRDLKFFGRRLPKKIINFLPNGDPQQSIFICVVVQDLLTVANGFDLNARITWTDV